MNRHAVITALGVTQILAWGSSYYLLAVLAAPIEAETGWPLPWIVGALSAGLVVAGLVSPGVGRAIGVAGGRSVLALSAGLIAAGQVIVGLSSALPVFVVGWLVLGAGMGAGLYDPAFATLGRLYGASARSAITVLTLWGGFASTVCWPLSAWLMSHLGWRETCFVYAAIQLGFSLPLLLAVVPRTVPALPAAADHGPSSDAPLDARGRRAFILLAGILVIGGAIMAIISVHLMTLLQAQGMTLTTAVAFGAMMGPAQVGGRLIEMAGRGRHHPMWSLTAAISLIALGLILLWGGFLPVAAAIVLYGAGNGVYSIARGTLPLALLGPARYAPLAGRLARPGLIAQALAPFLGAFVLDRAGAGATFGLLTMLGLINLGLVSALWSLHAVARP